ncbi:flavodoxin domain-containing protein [Microbacterium sp.]|uniref:flavodoxin domain-containing protein n=1 Tax=Microbacterium sp. TaxID=51671 RepID=UPI003C74E371
MKSLVVFESQFGNTQSVAESIAEGLKQWGPVETAAVDNAPAVLDDDLDLLVVGGPTHTFSMSRPETRAAAVTDGAVGTTSGVRDWLDALPSPVPVPRVALFSTRQGHSRLTGSAAKAAAKSLRHHGTPPEEVTDFFVTGKQGPLEPGERDRALAWGQSLGS